MLHGQDGRSLRNVMSAGQDTGAAGLTAGVADNITLTAAEHDLFMAEIAGTLQEIQSCAASTERVNISAIKSNAKVRVESGKDDGYTLECTFTSRGTSTSDHTYDAHVELITFEDPTQFEITQIAPFDFFPACTQELIAKEVASGLHATGASTDAEKKIEVSQAFTALPHLNAGGGTTKKRLQSALRRQQATATDFATGGRFERHGLGYTPAKLSATFDVRPRNAIALLRSLPDHYHPFNNNSCLNHFPARDQGTCGSCYAFAASTASSLSYCLALARKGITFPETPVLSAQIIVSCGSRMPVEGAIRVKMNTDDSTGFVNFQSTNYNSGCDGGSGVASFKFQKDVGFPYTSCYPYASGGGDPLKHFDAAKGELPECHNTCTGTSFEGESMETFTGLVPSSHNTASIEVCRGEAAMMECMVRLGPMFCSFDVYSDFSDHDTSGVYSGPVGDAYKRGGHAVVCFGWDVTESGTKHWKCLNSWGAWGEHKRGEFYIEKGANTANVEGYGCSGGVIDESKITGLPPFSPPLPPLPPLPPSPPPPPMPPPKPPWAPDAAPSPPSPPRRAPIVGPFAEAGAEKGAEIGAGFGSQEIGRSIGRALGEALDDVLSPGFPNKAAMSDDPNNATLSNEARLLRRVTAQENSSSVTTGDPLPSPLPVPRAQSTELGKALAQGVRCVKVSDTNFDRWFSKRSPPRKAAEDDCRYTCDETFHNEWCTGYEFVASETGTCKLFDNCTGAVRDWESAWPEAFEHGPKGTGMESDTQHDREDANIVKRMTWHPRFGSSA